MRELIRRIESATPPDRDRAADALRALAVLGVVLGHWLVTALVLDSGVLRGGSPLQHLPAFTPVSWAFQTLAVFFLVSGRMGARSHSAARARGATYRQWLGTRLMRLFRPVAVLLAVWTVAVVVMLAQGVDGTTLYTLGKRVLSPLWFLLVLAGLTAATPLVAKVHPLWPFAVVLNVDLIRFGLHGPDWLNSVNIAAGWLVPYCLGAAWARGGLQSRATGWTLLSGGTALTAGLVLLAGYPASMVGVPGQEISNLDPPTLAVVSFGLAQCGAALLLLGPLRRVLARPAVWAVVALVGLASMTVFLWHQTAMMTVTALGLLAGEPLPGLHTAPDSAAWVLARLAWLPAFAVALLVCWAAFHTYEHGRRQGLAGPAYVRVVSGKPGP
ncbi:acyltransferase family protein [Streptomyces yaizuensis]|uniref:Acyltransferase n=1 Tax=Streptomyces yaizuensis TaxID=2989713 RepID=A0ABQ5NSE8_9ACTN|nr:acyltransferase [Streptomyces sp. YSPA8]GLF93289.1 acyltransferase [Streptomyces sp. YSPA8]